MYRILFVDDEALIREAVSDNVNWEQYGYELAGSCENGKEALEFIEKNPVDVVLTDICMPYLDGMELSEKLSENYPSVKIIILSGYDDFDYAKKAIRYGVKEYLLKPITAEEMGEALLSLKAEMDKEKKAERKVWELESAYRKGQELLYSDTLLHLIRGSKADEESCKELEKIGLNLDSAVYRVAIVELDIYARSGKLDEKRKRESALMAFVLHNISQEMVQQSKAGEVCQGKDHRTYILFHSGKPEELRQPVKDICYGIIAQMNGIMQLAVNIGLGCCVTETEKIYLSYEEAEEALEYHYVLGGNHIMEMEAIREEKRQADVDGMLDGIGLHIKGNEVGEIEEDFALLEKELRECRYERQSAGVILQRVVDMADEICKASEMENGQRVACKEEILKKALAAGELEEAVDILCTYCI
ncbi:MAG: response regulator, partial [Kineothrix sp.]|nr:response regulator [Kineothrix sp.]